MPRYFPDIKNRSTGSETRSPLSTAVSWQLRFLDTVARTPNIAQKRNLGSRAKFPSSERVRKKTLIAQVQMWTTGSIGKKQNAKKDNVSMRYRVELDV